MSRRTRAAAATTSRILWSSAAGLLLLLLLQNLLGDDPRIAVLGHGLFAAWMFGWNLPVLRSVRTAVMVLIALSVAATLGTLAVQRSHLTQASEEEFYDTFAFATAHLLVKATHPLPGDVALSPEHERRLERTRLAFGEEVYEEEAEGLLKGLAAQRDEAAARDLAERHTAAFAALYRLASWLRFTDLYRAWWFHGLFYLLAVNLLAGAVLRRPLSVRNVGFHGSHLGLVLIVIGVTAGSFLGERGMMPLQVGSGASSFFDEHTGGVRPLGFTVRLDRFETIYHEDLIIEELAMGDPHHGAGMGGGGATLRHTVAPELGEAFVLGDPDGGEQNVLTIREITEATGLQRRWRAASEGEQGEPVVRFDPAFPDPRAGDDGLWLGPGDGIYIDPQNRYKLRVEPLAAGDAAATDDGCGEERHGTLTLSQPGSPDAVLAVAPGAHGALGELDATVLEIVPDFKVGAGPGRLDDFPRNPAVRVRLTDADGVGGDFLLFSDPRLKGFTTLPWDGVELSFDYDYWCAPTGARLRLQVAPDDAVHGAVEVPGGAVTVHEALAAATVEVVPEEGDPAPGSPLRTALRLGVEGPDGEHERWLLCDTADGAVRLGPFVVMLASNTDRPPRDWISHLSFLEEGVVVAEGAAEVNAPVHYRGYGFFQSDADPARPEYSGLQVVRDPAWTPVKLGLWMLLLGIAWVFYVQPLFDRRGEAR